MNFAPELTSVRLLALALACSVGSACGRSDLDDVFMEGAADGDDGTGANGSGRGGGIGNGGTEPGSGGTEPGRGGAFGGTDTTGGRGGKSSGGAAGFPTTGGVSTGGTPLGGAAGVGGVGGGGPGGTQGTAGASGSGGTQAAGAGGQPSGVIRCGELTCEPRVSVCCRGGGQVFCGTTLDECPRVGLACTGASTCEPELVCCLRRGRATCEPTCEPGDPGPGRGFHLCDSSAECGPDQTCISGPRGLTWCADNFP